MVKGDGLPDLGPPRAQAGKRSAGLVARTAPEMLIGGGKVAGPGYNRIIGDQRN